jgi:hypothetical protein
MSAPEHERISARSDDAVDPDQLDYALVPAYQEHPMSRRQRRHHSPAFKAKVAIAAIKGERTITQIAEQFDVHPNQVTT